MFAESEAEPSLNIHNLRDGSIPASYPAVPCKDGLSRSMYLEFEKDEFGKYRSRDSTRPVDEREYQSKDPPYTHATYWSKNQDGTIRTREKSLLEIRSKSLLDLMTSVMCHMIDHERATIWRKLPVVVQTTNKLLLHCFEDLDQVSEARENPDQAARQALRQLLDDVQYIESDFVRAQDSLKNEQALRYDDIWFLFKPGSYIVGWPFEESPQIFVVHRHNFRDDTFTVVCWAYGWDGNDLVRLYYEFTIRRYQGVKSVSDLPCYPVELFSDPEKLREQLIERGKEFWKYCSVTKPMPLYRSSSFFSVPANSLEGVHMDLSGRFMSEFSKQPMEIYTSRDRPHEIIIDAAMCRRYSPSSYHRLGMMRSMPVKPCGCGLCDLHGLRGLFEESLKTGNLDVGKHIEVYALLPPRLHGYLISRKEWGQVLIGTVTQYQEEHPGAAWNNLCLSKQDKFNINAMVSAYFKREANENIGAANIQDPTPGKGEGLVILLHGTSSELWIHNHG
jgi:hypothetical protein